MNNRILFSHPLCVTLAVSLLACVAFATLARATTSATGAGPETSTDIRVLCPGVDAALQSALQTAWWRHRLPATLRVQMQLQSGEVAGVRLVGGPRVYGADIKRAVRNLKCDAGSGDAQTVLFEVNFVDEAEPATTLALGTAEQRLR